MRIPERIPESELIINSDGSVFHLHIKPEELADNVIMVGDPDRVIMISSLLSNIESRSANREFVSVTGYYNGKRITVLWTSMAARSARFSLPTGWMNTLSQTWSARVPA